MERGEKEAVLKKWKGTKQSKLQGEKTETALRREKKSETSKKSRSQEGEKETALRRHEKTKKEV